MGEGAVLADCVWTKRECRSSDRVDKPGTTRTKRVAPTLPTLIHPLPTLRRTTPTTGGERLRRDNTIFFILNPVGLALDGGGHRNLGQRQTAAITIGSAA